ncbi:hypothetical protein BJV82DRAFT_652730 [Fennellomyces sp. T-0311]|nr:hypothetical protein BJV82DRAFT_652730 [Fennellomyces sp. T-0311]
MHILTLFVLAIITMPYFVYCFCIYNDFSDDSRFFVRQVAGYHGGTIFSRFKHKDVKPGEYRCCHHTQKTCVGGDEYSVVKFYIRTFNTRGEINHFEITCPGGGYIVLWGDELNPQVKVHFANGTPYLYERDNNGHTRWLSANLNKTRELNHDTSLNETQVGNFDTGVNKTRGNNTD